MTDRDLAALLFAWGRLYEALDDTAIADWSPDQLAALRDMQSASGRLGLIDTRELDQHNDTGGT